MKQFITYCLLVLLGSFSWCNAQHMRGKFKRPKAYGRHALHLNVAAPEATVETTKSEKQKNVQSRTVQITNAITKKMITYHKFGAHVPSSFTLHVNGQSLAERETKAITVEDNKLNVTYHFKFGNYRKGTRTVEFAVEPTTEKASVSFAWKDTWRMKVSGAKPVAIHKA